jgi:DNA-binding response OmpR family regulator
VGLQTGENGGRKFYIMIGGGLVEKVLVLLYEGEKKSTFDELISFLEEKGYTMLNNAFSTDSLKYDGLIIDQKRRTVTGDWGNIELTNYEFDILYLLASSPGQVFSKAQIYGQVWKTPYYGAEDNVMSLIRRIRKKIEPDPAKPIYILTVWGVGYKFNEAIKRK